MMPSEQARVELAVRNQAALDHLASDPEKYCEWIATIAFYKALQVVEAVFTHDPDQQHGDNHGRRHGILKGKKCYSHIWKYYRPLWSASAIARYLRAPEGPHFSSFSQYMAPDQVYPLLVGHYLHQVQMSARQFLSEDAQKKLGLRVLSKTKKAGQRRKH